MLTNNQGCFCCRHLHEGGKLAGTSGVLLVIQAEADKDVDVGGAAWLKTAFARSTVVFGVTDFWGLVGDPKVQDRFEKTGHPLNVIAHEFEVQQGRNIVDPANATVETLDRSILSTLSSTKKWSKGRITHNLHFDGKWEAVEYMRASYPAVAKKTSYLQVALYVTNWKGSPMGRPTQVNFGLQRSYYAESSNLKAFPVLFAEQ